MSFQEWMTVIGGLLLLMALSSAYLRSLPISTSAIYLALGVAMGPLGAAALLIDLRDVAPWFERLTEVALIISLFVGGLKLRLSWRRPEWRAAYLLAGPGMLASIGGVALYGWLFLGLDGGVALLLGALLASTDPVLASAVSVNDAADLDRVRYGLSGEAGLNDGLGFPFVVFALAWMEHEGPGPWILGWALHWLVWAVPAGLLLGFVLGRSVGRLAIWLRTRHRDTAAPSDFLGLALIALAYVAAGWIGALGFLAVFAAGVGLRSAEVKVVAETPHPDAATAGDGAPISHPAAELLVSAHVDQEALKEPAIAAGVLVAETISFGDTAERLLEVTLVGIVGVCLARHWDARAIPLALALFLVIRPVSVDLLLRRAPVTPVQRSLMDWFGIRGIGSLYALSYALNRGASGAVAAELAGLTISVVALSILAHGMTAQPALARYERALRPT